MKGVLAIARRTGVLVVLVAAGFLPSLLGSGYMLDLVDFLCINIVLTMGLDLLFGFGGMVSFGYAGFWAMGAYGTVILSRLGLPFVLAVPATLAVTGAFAWLFGYPLLKLKDHYLGMATLAFGLLVYTVLMQWIALTGGPDGIMMADPAVFGLTLTRSGQHVVVLAGLALAGFVCTNLTRSKLGLSLRAIKGEETGAEFCGIDVTATRLVTFALSSVLAALAGVLYASFRPYITPETFGLNASILVVTMVVVGGMGSIRGNIIGAALFTAIPELIHGFQRYHLIIYGALLLAALLFFPTGLAGVARGLRPWQVAARPVKGEVPAANVG